MKPGAEPDYLKMKSDLLERIDLEAEDRENLQSHNQFHQKVHNDVLPTMYRKYFGEDVVFPMRRTDV